jgi:hypothetical protein
MSKCSPRAVAVLLASVAVAAASGTACDRSGADGSVADAGSPPADVVALGRDTYSARCATCHGGEGEGGTGPSLRDWSRGMPALVDVIARTMPFGSPGTCAGECATSVAAYILATFTGGVACAAPSPAPRGLRLLARREYLATVTDLLQAPQAAGGASPASCNVDFRYDPGALAPGKVHVAGTFNGWAGTVAAGGWPMAWDAAAHAWSVTRPLAPAQYAYKLVLDESKWIPDPRNPATVADGQGGQNSVLTVSCAAGGGGGGGGGASGTPAALPFDPTSSFPVDTRPQDFAFDDDGPSRSASPVHVEQYQAAATAVAAYAVDRVPGLVTCAAGEAVGACAHRLVQGLGTRILRRPATAAEASRYEALVTGAKDFPGGAALAIRAMLTSPAFLYRSEIGLPEAAGTFRLTPWELASALSYMFWGSMPDQALFDAAASGELATAAGLEKHARRLLASPRARDAVGVFAEQWLGIGTLPTAVKDEAAFPGLSPAVRASMREETRRFVTHVIFDGSHTLGELYTAPFTFVDAPLAQFYGLPAPATPGFAKVAYPDARRAGLLGHGSVLATTAHSDQTSPILRGLFVRRALLCQQFGTPPPNAGGIPRVDPGATTRERFGQHASSPACATCHSEIDPVGFGFERFDPIGRIRDTENGKPVDSAGDLLDVERLAAGTHAPFATLGELGTTLAASQAARDCFARQYYRFARGRREDGACALRDASARFASSGYDVRELMVGIALSSDFAVRR